MPICPSCGQDNPDIARFCLACGTALGPAPAAEGEERKVVTVLFCDLVGFTARSMVSGDVVTRPPACRRWLPWGGGGLPGMAGPARLPADGCCGACHLPVRRPRPHVSPKWGLARTPHAPRMCLVDDPGLPFGG